MVRQWQQMFFEKRYASTEMVNPDFVAISKGYFIESKKVSSRDNLDDGIKEMLKFNGPYLLEVIIEKEANVFPMIPTGSSVSEIRLE
jgi:acetolactate synthase-1/2/3 large subunit